METNDIWAAGMISTSGSLQFIQTGKPFIRLTITSKKYPEAVRRLGEQQGMTVREMAGVPIVAIAGKPLHKLMTKLWPELTNERKREYLGWRQMLKDALARTPEATGSEDEGSTDSSTGEETGG